MNLRQILTQFGRTMINVDKVAAVVYDEEGECQIWIEGCEESFHAKAADFDSLLAAQIDRTRYAQK